MINFAPLIISLIYSENIIVIVKPCISPPSLGLPSSLLSVSLGILPSQLRESFVIFSVHPHFPLFFTALISIFPPFRLLSSMHIPICCIGSSGSQLALQFLIFLTFPLPKLDSSWLILELLGSSLRSGLFL